MERRELYEPEDIEQLLIERPYDELLEMERAFVLRHLSGRAEYEAMRALLLNVHDDAARIEPIDAAPEVRSHLMDVFRAEQQPQWRIWLNSVHAFLLPKEASAMWRPALAFGSVALVIFFVAIRGASFEQAPQLADLKEVPVPAKVESHEPTPVEPDHAAAPQEDLAHVKAPLNAKAEPAPGNANSIPARERSDRADETEVMIDQATIAAQPAPPASVENTADFARTEDLQATAIGATAKGLFAPPAASISVDSAILANGSITHIVTSNELQYNFSAAAMDALPALESVSAQSARRTDRERAKKYDTRKRVTADDASGDASADAGAYIGLLRAAW